jgi:hypothetical protein
MASSQYNSFIVAPDPKDPNYGPSADNIPITSGTPGTPVTVANIINGATGTFYTIATNLFPQPTGASYVYRLTFNTTFSALTLGNTGGNVTVYAFCTNPDASTFVLCAQTIWINGTISGTTPLLGVSMSAEWVPVTGQTLQILLRNHTGAGITNTTMTPTAKGCAIELVSKAAAPQLIFS